MKVELDCWGMATTGSGFEVDMTCPPRVGETLQIHESRFPDYYRRSFEDGLPSIEGYVHAVVLRVDHKLQQDGRHLVRVDFEFED